MAFIYVLHFDVPLHHARHYVGCTKMLKNRLTAHANGAGSHLTKALMKEGITWRLGSLMTCTATRMRELERSLKDQNNSPRYCSICTANAAQLAGTEHYPVDELRFPTTSDGLKRIGNTETVQTVRLTQENESRATMMAIKAMMKADKDALGFIPAGGQGGLQAIVNRGLIAIATKGNEIVGYAAFNMNPSKTRLAIHQCCTRDDYRFLGIGTAMVNLIIGSHDVEEVTAKVRNDLAANHFWQRLGFTVKTTVRHKTSGNLINHYSLIKAKG